MDPGYVPIRIEVQKQAKAMRVEWKNNEVHRIRLSDLRNSCPCATCAEQREQSRSHGGLHMISNAEMAVTDEILQVRPVGRYAIKVAWADGHDTGIYTYTLLHELGARLGEKD